MTVNGGVSIRRTRRSFVAAACVFAGLAVAPWLGCDGRPTESSGAWPDDPSNGAPSSRWVSRYRGGERTWVPEKIRQPKAQQRPIMVINEVTEFAPGTEATPAQERAAQALVDECFEAAKRHRWFQFKNGIDNGFELLHGDRRHFYKREFVLDDATLDCDRPEFLMYYETEKGMALAGFMFYVAKPLARGPQIGGPLTIWHYHVWAPVQCLVENLLLVGQADDEGRCTEGEPGHLSPEILHVWLMERPLGPFTTSMYLPKEELATLLERRAAPSVRPKPQS
jgi:hypothetical protein